jgi:copper transport protein
VSARLRTGVTALAVAAVLALPAVASAHAYLVRTSPSASVIVNVPPRELDLTYDEAVEPRFAIVSVTDANGTRVTAGPPHRSPSNPDTLVVPLQHLPEGWYLVYWRAISADGHPVRGAFTFAVGPNAGPAPQFVIPSTSETAATPGLLIARWVVFLSAMAAVGLYALRMLIARPLVRRVEGTRLRAVSIAFGVAMAVALVATPIYVVMATAEFALRSTFALGALVPLMRVSAFGRGYLDLELCLVLFGIAAGISIWVDRPERERRSVAEILSVTGAVLAALTVVLVPGLAGHAAQTPPRGLSTFLDWLHVLGGSVWIGGLAGLLVLWWSLPGERRPAGLRVCVPRFSSVAFVAVLALIGAGTWAAVLHLPTLGSLWQTSYGKALLVKIGILCVALVLAAVNRLRTTPRLAGRVDDAGAVSLLRRLVGGEVVLVAGAVFAAAVLSSLAPPPKALAAVGGAAAHVGPGPVTQVVTRNGYRFELHVDPNRAAVPNSFTVKVTRGGKPVRGAQVVAKFDMLDMEMGQQAYALREIEPGVYSHAAPALVMVGHWGLTFQVQPPGSPEPIDVLVVDHATG